MHANALTRMLTKPLHRCARHATVALPFFPRRQQAQRSACSLAAALMLSMVPMVALGADELPPCGNPIAVPDKPSLENYDDYTDFVVDIMDYKEAHRQHASHARQCPQDYQSNMASPSSDDPTVIEGPETLDDALVRAQQMDSLDYEKNPTWYNRSTSRSFDLPSLPPPSLASERLRTMLANAGEDEPTVLPASWLSLQQDDLKDGSAGQLLQQTSRYQQLPEREQDAAMSVYLLNHADILLGEILPARNLTLFIDAEDSLYRTTGLVEVESCLSSGCPNQQ